MVLQVCAVAVLIAGAGHRTRCLKLSGGSSAALAGGDQRADLRRTVFPAFLEPRGRQHQAAPAAAHARGAQEVSGCRPSLKPRQALRAATCPHCGRRSCHPPQASQTIPHDGIFAERRGVFVTLACPRATARLHRRRRSGRAAGRSHRPLRRQRGSGRSALCAHEARNNSASSRIEISLLSAPGANLPGGH